MGTLDDGVQWALAEHEPDEINMVGWFSEFNETLADWYMGNQEPWATPLGDLKQINWDEAIPPDPRRSDLILTAGYPCQGESVAGRKLGDEDPRWLWPHVAKAIRELRPRLVFLENVRNHLRVGFQRVLADLADIGFDAEWGTFQSAQIGAPHKRERLFVLAWPADTGGQGLEEWQEQSARNELAPA